MDTHCLSFLVAFGEELDGGETCNTISRQKEKGRRMGGKEGEEGRGRTGGRERRKVGEGRREERGGEGGREGKGQDRRKVSKEEDKTIITPSKSHLVPRSLAESASTLATTHYSNIR